MCYGCGPRRDEARRTGGDEGYGVGKQKSWNACSGLKNKHNRIVDRAHKAIKCPNDLYGCNSAHGKVARGPMSVVDEVR